MTVYRVRGKITAAELLTTVLYVASLNKIIDTPHHTPTFRLYMHTFSSAAAAFAANTSILWPKS